MKRSAIDRYIETVLHEPPERNQARSAPTVAISRNYGAGASDIAPLLASRLGVMFYDKEILQGIVQRVKGDPLLMRQLDEAASPDPVFRVVQGFSGIAATDEYSRALVEVVLSIARCGGVILGRGAHLIVSAPDMYRVYLRASPETCVKRIAKRADRDLIWAQHERNRIENDRHHFLKHLFGHDEDRFDEYDLMINTDRIEQPEAAVDVIVAGLRASGLYAG